MTDESKSNQCCSKNLSYRAITPPTNNKDNNNSIMANNESNNVCNVSETIEGNNCATADAVVTIPPDGGWGWMVVLSAFFVFFITDGMAYSLGVFLDAVATDLGCSKSMVSFDGAIGAGVLCISGPFVASLVNRYGYRKIGIIGASLAFLSTIVTSYLRDIKSIYFVHGFIGGLGIGMVQMPSIIAVGFYFDRWRAVATCIALTGSGLGSVVLPLIIPPLIKNYGWQLTFRVLGGVLALTLICTLSYRPLKTTLVRTTMTTASVATTCRSKTPFSSRNFFQSYNNRAFPTIAEIIESPTVTLLPPRNLHLSSELMIASSYQSSVLTTVTKGDDKETIASEVELEPQMAVYNPTTAPIVVATTNSQLDKKMSKFKRRKLAEGAPRPSNLSTCTTVSTMRPLYRDDIFLFGSYRSSMVQQKLSTKSAIPEAYLMSVTRMAPIADLEDGPEQCCHFFRAVSIKRTLATMLDYTLLKSPVFLLIALNAISVSLGFWVPYMFVQDRAIIEHKIDSRVAYLLLSIMGLLNTIGRISCGLINAIGLARVDYVFLSAAGLLIGGVATIASVHLTYGFAQVAYVAIFGLVTAPISSLRTIIIVEVLGLDRLTNAFGLTLMCQGIASLIGTLIAGWLRDASGTYDLSFYFTGLSLISGAVILFPLRVVAVRDKRRRLRKMIISPPATAANNKEDKEGGQ